MSPFDLDHNEDIPADIAATFPSRYRDADRIQAIIGGFGDACQMFEDLVFTYLVDTTLDLATGDQLDHWGSLVGEARGPFDDGTYRELIKARSTVNVADNSIDDIIEVYRRSTGAEKIWYFDHHPTHFRLEALRNEWMPPERVGRVLEHMDLAVAGGVGVTLVEATPGEMRFGGSGFGSTQSRVIN